jgi:YesN/AraC family two-component response regulator
VMGISFVDYVNYKRIKKAERLLLTGDLSIMEVSFEVGILNMAQFYKLFKRHNQCSPKEFKQRMRSQSGLTPLLAQAD